MKIAPCQRAMKRVMSGRITAPTITPPTTEDVASPKDSSPLSPPERISPSGSMPSAVLISNTVTTIITGTSSIDNRLIARKP